MLSGFRVVEVATRPIGLGGLLLAQHGADVVVVGASAVEGQPMVTDSGGVASAADTVAFGRGKRSLAIDLADPAGMEMFERLVSQADVLLESWTPDERTRLGYSPEATTERFPALIHASITPFGIDGPKADWATSDITIMASASPLALTGDTDRAPVRMSLPQAFSFGGAAGAGAALLALYERERSGRGQHIDVSAQAAAALATQSALLATGVGAPPAARSAGGAIVAGMTLRFLYPARDGYVSITHVFGPAAGPATTQLMKWVHEAGFCDEAMRDVDWVGFADLIDSGEQSTETWEEAKRCVEAFTSSLTKAELLEGAIERGLLMAPVADLADLLTSPHLASRDFFRPTTLPDGQSVLAPGLYARYSRWTPPALSSFTDPEPPDGEVWPEESESTGTKAADRPATGEAERSAPLEGVKVLDLTWSAAGPFMTRVLADHGATVVKVESTSKVDASRTFIPFHNNEVGLENSAFFDNANAGKLSLTLDISAEGGRAVLDDLIGWADVVIDSLSPRGRSAIGLDDERVRALNPDVINVSLSLFGLDGPLASLAGFGNLGAAMAGCYEITGWPDRPPAGPYLAYTDYTSAHLMLVTVVTSLLHRHLTGQGQFVELSQTETALQFLAPALIATQATGELVTRIGNDDAVMAPHGVYAARDEDTWVAVACSTNQHWTDLCGLMNRPDLAEDPNLAEAHDRLRQRRDLDTAVTEWTSALAADAVMHACQAAGIPAHTVQNSSECLADPQLRHRGHFVELDHPDRLCLVENTRFRLGSTPGKPQRRPPTLGEHTFEILSDFLGYDVDRVADLAAAQLLE